MRVLSVSVARGTGDVRLEYGEEDGRMRLWGPGGCHRV